MLIPSNSRLAQWKYVEAACYRQWIDKETGKKVEAVVRHQDYETKESILLEWGQEVLDYREKNKLLGVYTSVFRYNKRNIESSTRFGPIYFDFDDDQSIDLPLREVNILYNYLKNIIETKHIHVYFTGSKGFHLEVEPIAVGISPSVNLDKGFRFIAGKVEEELDLSTLDFSVYDPRRMWRMNNSIHQKTNLYKVEIPHGMLSATSESIRSYAEEPHELFNPDGIKLSISANEWYKNLLSLYDSEVEEARERAAEKRAELFGKYGTSIVKKRTPFSVKKVWSEVIDNLKNTEVNKNRNVTLSRQGYKLFLSMMEADMDPQKAFDVMIDIALEIGLEVREAKATLKSAMRAAEKKFAEDPQVILKG